MQVHQKNPGNSTENKYIVIATKGAKIGNFLEEKGYS